MFTLDKEALCSFCHQVESDAQLQTPHNTISLCANCASDEMLVFIADAVVNYSGKKFIDYKKPNDTGIKNYIDANMKMITHQLKGAFKDAIRRKIKSANYADITIDPDSLEKAKQANPDLPEDFIKGVLKGMEEVSNGEYTEYTEYNRKDFE